jgi:hypothetical protein
MCNGETPEGGDMDQSETKEGNSSKKASESQPPQLQRKEKEDGRSA